MAAGLQQALGLGIDDGTPGGGVPGCGGRRATLARSPAVEHQMREARARVGGWRWLRIWTGMLELRVWTGATGLVQMDVRGALRQWAGLIKENVCLNRSLSPQIRE